MNRDITGKSLIFIFVLCILLISNSCSSTQGESEVVGLYGNTVCNLRNGGSIAQKDDNLFCVIAEDTRNKIVVYDKTSRKARTLKTFLSIPTQLNVYDKFLFYKKNLAMLGDSGLYRINTKTKTEKMIIKESISEYIIYGNNIYYTINSQSDDRQNGLYKCDINGKNHTLLIPEKVSEFIIVEKDIYYIAEYNVKKYDIHSGEKNDILCGEEDRGYYDLNFYTDNLYCVSHNLNDDLGDTVYKYDTTNQEVATIFKGIKASIRFIDNTLLIFQNRDGFYMFNVDTSSQTLFLDKFAIDEIYVFDTDVYFYTTNIKGEMEIWQSDLSGSFVQKIFN